MKSESEEDEEEEKRNYIDAMKELLPFDVHDLKPGSSDSHNEGKFPDYLRRLLDFRQMDFEAAFEQFFTLMSTEPQKV